MDLINKIIKDHDDKHLTLLGVPMVKPYKNTDWMPSNLSLRLDQATGKYSQTPNDGKGYFLKYYYEKRKREVKCEICNETISHATKAAHMKTEKCRKIAAGEYKPEIVDPTDNQLHYLIYKKEINCEKMW